MIAGSIDDSGLTIEATCTIGSEPIVTAVPALSVNALRTTSQPCHAPAEPVNGPASAIKAAAFIYLTTPAAIARID